ncbi:BSD domain (BTF2 transcription factor, Synapse-associated protein and DOS2-like protein) [Trifolium repens]|nr:BSD domain (BTF2 transcription factor, Synapse-associated protein and DOS2-like protein) [Trifolium repens]
MILATSKQVSLYFPSLVGLQTHSSHRSTTVLLRHSSSVAVGPLVAAIARLQHRITRSSTMVARKYLKLNIPCIGEHCYKILTDKVLNGLTKNISSTKSHLGKNSHENVFDLLPSTTREKLLDHWLCSQELLRHFWSSYPITAQNLINKSTSPLFPFLCMT